MRIIFCIYLLFNLFSTKLSSQSLQEGLVGHWKFEDNALDGSPSEDHGIIHNVTPVADRFKIENSAYYFNGIDSYIEFNNINHSAFSFSAWISDFNLLDTSTIFSKGLFNKEFPSFHFESAPDYFAVSTRTIDESSFIAIRDYEFKDSTYYHLLITMDEIEYQLFLNGELMGTKKMIPGPLTLNPFPKILGVNCSFGDNSNNKFSFFHGVIDDVFMWNRVLSSNEIQKHFETTRIHQLTIDTIEIPILGTELEECLKSGIKIPIDTIFNDFNPQGYLVNNKVGNFKFLTNNIIDTITVFDTIPLYDTITVYDTISISVTDTLFINLTSTNINKIDVNIQLKIFPNPSSEYITIEVKDQDVISDFSIEIVNLSGAKVYETKLSSNELNVDLKNIGPVGTYFIVLKDFAGNQIEHKTLIIH